MYPDSVFNEPVSSYQSPIDVLSVEPDDAPLETVCVNSSWLELLRGCAKQLLLQTTWNTSDPDALNLAQQRAFNLIDLLQEGKCVLPTFPTGTIVQFAGPYAPDGWLFCEGEAVSRSEYAALFTVIGTIYGNGDGISTFTLPNLAQRVPAGVDLFDSLWALGEAKGDWNTTIDLENMPAHHHQETVFSTASPFFVAAKEKISAGSGSGFGVQAQSLSSGNFQAQNTMDTGGTGILALQIPTLTLNFMIKT